MLPVMLLLHFKCGVCHFGFGDFSRMNHSVNQAALLLYSIFDIPVSIMSGS